ncbi:hypothetical protein CQA62_05210 [Helicobacter cholecystus]|uniref:Uncharacterized protein n=1 Tax=Helicobacter cholecystus TaxID=45498 RepID=A0A3D8IU25_9HELI|nr:mechanosensitive ion channel domain-containing protein [Helicobacter cholecystus]RDU68789.1 hypothetical protein CQA62_05210 [Helicobacter cholecystus]VEJ23933.1 mechanosensitive ion channel membrane protein [Helicobacter cholecystus]
MKKWLYICLISVFLFAKDQVKDQTIEEKIKSVKNEMIILDTKLNADQNVWIYKYGNHAKYISITNQIKALEWQIKRIKPTSKNSDQLQILNNRLETLQRQKVFFGEIEGNPYQELIEVKDIEKIPTVTNPFAILGAKDFIKQIQNQEKILRNNLATLKETLMTLQDKKTLLNTLLKLEDKDERPILLDEIQKIQNIEIELKSAQGILETSLDVYFRKANDIISKLNEQIQQQVIKIIYVFIICLTIICAALAIKFALKKYLDQERLYIANKVVNFVNIFIIALVLLLSYLNNITYLVTFLGFVSAGLAFAMRDLFMSFLGWFVIIIGGGLHVGDRIRVHRDNTTYVGDILDISMTRITLLEDVTLNTYMETRRAGRIILIPNNLIFTAIISNYTHGGMSTVWDGIDFTVTFDSNYKKAIEIATEVARKHSKSHTEIGKKRMMRLKEHYSIKRISLEPRVFNMIEPNGMRISIWYQSNVYATLNLRSNICGEIIEILAKESDIKIAYPTTKLINTGSDGVWERYTHQNNP